MIQVAQPAITSKLTIETLEQGVKYVKVNNKDIRTTPTPCYSVSIVNFEQVTAGWVCSFQVSSV